MTKLENLKSKYVKVKNYINNPLIKKLVKRSEKGPPEKVFVFTFLFKVGKYSKIVLQAAKFI